MGFPVDAVITWVDGNDPVLNEKRAQYLPKKAGRSDLNSSTRYANCNEILYCVGSILKFAPYVRNIFIVTDNQTPDIFDRLKARFGEDVSKIKIIDHKDIFIGHEQYLPTFSSIAIETFLHNIPDLAEHYIYFNDDMFLIKRTTFEDFFNENGEPALRASWSSPEKLLLTKTPKIIKKLKLKKSYYANNYSQALANKLAGIENNYVLYEHTPYPYRKTTIREFFRTNPELMTQNSLNKFRDVNNVNLNALHYALEIQAGNQNFKDHALCYMKPHRQKKKKRTAYIERKLTEAHGDNNILFLCAQSLDELEDHDRNLIVNWLEEIIFDS